MATTPRRRRQPAHDPAYVADLERLTQQLTANFEQLTAILQAQRETIDVGIAHFERERAASFTARTYLASTLMELRAALLMLRSYGCVAGLPSKPDLTPEGIDRVVAELVAELTAAAPSSGR